MIKSLYDADPKFTVTPGNDSMSSAKEMMFTRSPFSSEVWNLFSLQSWHSLWLVESGGIEQASKEGTNTCRPSAADLTFDPRVTVIAGVNGVGTGTHEREAP